MKAPLHTAALSALMLGTCLGLTGCAWPRTQGFEPLSNGYGEVVYESGIIHKGHRFELQYRAQDGRRSVIWPSLHHDPVIKDRLALFVGFRIEQQQEPVKRTLYRTRLLAVQAPGTLLDITSEVLRRWARTAGQDFTSTLRRADTGMMVQEGDGIVVDFSNPYIRTHLSWTEVEDVMCEVREQGVAHQEPVRGIVYLEKDYDMKEKGGSQR